MSLKDSIAELFKHDILKALLDSEIDEPAAAELSNRIFKKLQDNWGGSSIYFPKRPAYTSQQIREAFDGHNHAEVCQRFRISLKTLYRAIGG
ncbi:Mor transcription activator family protein [Methylomonas sp. HYX-M1]|uniref:Mor transcription activator family protein n=1 Tax=Methylomonas sp. HYX-M1 TaxID=3139307 RepID=UPI00345C4666